MEQHPVPQNVTTFQFRLIGDMTLKQFGYLAGGAILGYISYKLPLPFFFTWPAAATFALGGVGFAFVPVEERPMDVWFLSFVKSIYSPTQYLWQKTKTTPPVSTEKPPVVTPATLPTQTPGLSHTKPFTFAGINIQLDALKKQLLGTGTKKSKPEIVSPSLNGQASQPVVKAAAPAQAQPFVPVIPQQSAVQPIQIPKPVTQAVPPAQTNRPVAAQKQKSHVFDWIFSLFQSKPQKNNHTAPQQYPQPTASVHQSAPFTPIATQHAKPVAQSKIVTTNAFGLFDWFTTFFALRPQQSPQAAPAYAVAYPNVYQTAAAPSVTGTKMKPIETPPPPTAPVNQPVQDEEAKKKADELQQQMETLKKELQTKSMSEDRVLELQKQLLEVLDQKTKMEQEIQTLRQRLTQPQQPQQRYRSAGVATNEPEKSTVKVISADVAVKAGLPRLTTFPNVVTGIIKDTTGNLLPGVLVTVRDKEDIPVRALKTNKLGQFAASTPLPSGVYTVDIEDPKGTYMFDRVRITLNGTIMSALEIIAKSKREIDRAKLEREIFGAKTI